MKVTIEGGDKLEALLKDLQQSLKSKLSLKVGFPENSQGRSKGLTDARLAAYHEFGTSRMPERPFLRVSLMQNEKKYSDLASKGIKRFIKGELSLETIFKAIGTEAVNDVKAFIGDNKVMPPTSAKTIAMKRKKTKRHSSPNSNSHTTLIDTGNLRQSITFVVDDKEE